MCDKKSQNPVFPVDASMLEACLPKVICVQCGTVFGLRINRPVKNVRCPVCQARMTIHKEGREFVATANNWDIQG